MKKKTPQDLIDTYLSGRATDKEKCILESWYIEHAEQQVDVLAEPDYIHLNKELWPVIDQSTPSRAKPVKLWLLRMKQKKTGTTTFVFSAAAAALIIVTGVWIYSLSAIDKPGHANDTGPGISATHGIAPAKNTATLTLASSGKAIKLSDTELGVVIDARKFTYEDGSPIAIGPEDDIASVKTANGVNIDVSTPRGGTYQVVLPDGSRVWLNAASSIKFPLSFDGAAQRIVQLSGEAYFKVKKSPDIPFIVKTKGQETMVLGTEFNINNYADEGTVITTLVTGSLKVNADKGNSVLLVSGEETVLSPQGIHKQIADVEMSIAWKQGVFHFNKTSFDVMMRQVSRWYNVDVVYSTKKIPDIYFSGEIKRSVMLQTVLTYIQDLGVRLRLQGRTLFIE